MAINQRKAAVIGCGFVGASIAFSLMQRGLFSELVLIDANHRKAEGEAMDLSHGLPYAASMEIYAGTYADAADCALAIVTAGANQKPGETRLDLIGRNVSILGSILPQLTASGFEGLLLIVSNPVDVLTYAAQRISGFPKERVLGSGTVLDTARLKYELGRHPRGGQPQHPRCHHRRARRQRACRLERGECLRHRSEPFLRAARPLRPRGRDAAHL